MLFTACSAISVAWGFAIVHAATRIIIDFDLIYMGSRATIERVDPYDRIHIGDVYRVSGRPVPSVEIDPENPPPIVALQVYLPTAFLCVAPFALLPLTSAHILWTFITAAVFTLAALLIWIMVEKDAAAAGFYMIGFMLANCGVLFAGGNPAGLAVALCIIAVWCFLHDRYVAIGMCCLAISLALKPHDAGFIWLYFLLSGKNHRKRALGSLALTCGLALVAILWITPVSPHWITELSNNLAIISQRGGINDPGPAKMQIGPGMVIDLQSVFSVLWDVPAIYNTLAYLVAGFSLMVWIIAVVRTRFSISGAYFALASASCFTMLPNYHRPYDARLILLTVPACSLLLAKGGRFARIVLAVNAVAFVMVCDLPLAGLALLSEARNNASVITSRLGTLLLFRPVPLVLLTLGLFYLAILVQRSRINSGALHGRDAQQLAL